jgi:hypothetical protein
MRLRILNARPSSGADTIVDGDTGLGLISGRWRSKYPPEIGDDYDVELTLPDPSSLRVLADAQDHHPGVEAVHQEQLRFRGRCELIYEDGVVVMRLATNWSEMVVAETGACRVDDWIELTVPRAEVEIYPIGG